MPAKKSAASKRGAEEAKTPAPKKAKVDPMIAGILETVGMAENLPDNCKAMLVSMVPGAFGVVQEDRDRYQEKAVTMIGEVVETVRARLHRSVEAEDTKLSAIQGSKAGLEGQMEAARAGVAKAAAALDAQNAALAEVSTVVLENKCAFAAASEAQKSGDAPFVPMQSEKAEYEAIVAEEFQVVMEGTSQTKKQSDKVVAFAKRLAGVDESLLKAMPSTCLKKADARSQFDTMVLETLSKNLADHLASLTSQLEGAKAGFAERAAAVETAQAALEATKTKQQAAATGVSRAQAAHREAEMLLLAAETALGDFEPGLVAANHVAGEQKDKLDNFVTWNVACFEMLKDKRREPVVDGAAVAEATAPAAEATAPDKASAAPADASPARAGSAPTLPVA